MGLSCVVGCVRTNAAYIDPNGLLRIKTLCPDKIEASGLAVISLVTIKNSGDFVGTQVTKATPNMVFKKITCQSGYMFF